MKRCTSCKGRTRCAGYRSGVGVCRYCGQRCACGYSAHLVCVFQAVYIELRGRRTAV